MDTTTIAQEEVLMLVYEALDEVNATVLAPDRELVKSPETLLFGEGSQIDSLALVGLIVCIEQRAGEQFGAVITVVNEKAMSLRNSPFRTVGTLAEYVTELIHDAPQG